MANVDSAFGLKPYEGLSPSGAIPQARKYLINPSGYGTTIYQGDLVKFNGGYIEQAGVSDANIVGVFNGVHYQSSDGTVWSNFNTASTTASSGELIGEARAYAFNLADQPYLNNTSSWDLYLYDVQTFTKLTLNTSINQNVLPNTT